MPRCSAHSPTAQTHGALVRPPSSTRMVADVELPVDGLVELLTPAATGDETPPAPTWGA